MKPQENSDHFVRQRVLNLAVLNTKLVEQGETDTDGTTVFRLRAVDGAEQFEKMLRSYLPLKRFDTVLGETVAPSEWFDLKRLSPHDIEDAVEKGFDRYAAACTDYIVIGKVTSFSGKWSTSKAKDPKTGHEIEIPNLNANVKGQVVIFQRSGESFERISQFRASSGGLLGLASGFSNSLTQMVNDPTGTADRVGEIGTARELSYISLRPVEGCTVPNAREGVAALDCPGDTASLPELPGPPGMGESSKPICKDFEQIRTHRGAAICGIRKAGELFAVSAQKEARGVDGWRLFALLDPPSSGKRPSRREHPSIALGESEGLKRGMGFHAVTGNGDDTQRLAYAKIARVGNAQENGEQAPSEISWRISKAPVGTRMEEYPQIGFTLALGPAIIGPLLSNSNVVTGPETEVSAPSVLLGPEFEVGYDLTPYTFSEFWLRFRLNYSIAPISEYRFSTLNLQVGPEARLATFNRGYWFGNLAGNLSIAWLKSYVDQPGSTWAGEMESGSDAVGGLELRTGLDVMINADFHLRLSVGWLQNFGRLEYTKDEEVLFDRRDRLSGMTIALTLAYTL